MKLSLELSMFSIFCANVTCQNFEPCQLTIFEKHFEHTSNAFSYKVTGK